MVQQNTVIAIIIVLYVALGVLFGICLYRLRCIVGPSSDVEKRSSSRSSSSSGGFNTTLGGVDGEGHISPGRRFHSEFNNPPPLGQERGSIRGGRRIGNRWRVSNAVNSSARDTGSNPANNQDGGYNVADGLGGTARGFNGISGEGNVRSSRGFGGRDRGSGSSSPGGFNAGKN
ncbi:hypothetical protein VFPPC_14232 [Pochonia chlamydosporia 170]|uniref:Uncharacterized protein n=1 Tax=Pochonia chlamydosporia 170 TaxID=1380566 RepID=A0A179F935_METCM|nr:hypothetical protein VFPPC_14232 [Pochonia chlamydosporia 170]OAQ61850.1 hypothetical protein VFPPC_14232 [Pochonia chlamydosporia 170]